MGKVLRGSNRANSFLCQSPKSSRGGKCRGNSCCADGSKDWDCFYFWQEVIVTAKLCCNIFVHRSSQMFTFSAQDSKHLDRSHKVVWWATGYYPHHWANGQYTCRVGRQNRFVHILKLLASQSLSYIVFFFCAYLLFFTLFAELVLCNCACFKIIISLFFPS